jgi:hypothetical protein
MSDNRNPHRAPAHSRTGVAKAPRQRGEFPSNPALTTDEYNTALARYLRLRESLIGL